MEKFPQHNSRKREELVMKEAFVTKQEALVTKNPSPVKLSMASQRWKISL